MCAADVERAVGMECYATPGGRCRGRAKAFPEDFRVEETVSFDRVSKEPSPGSYPLYRVEKRGVDTMHMADEISRALKSRVSYGGMKDSRAVAVQYVTPTSLRSERPERIVAGRFSAEVVGYLPRPLTRASVVSNRFEIVLRGCCEDVGSRIDSAFAAARERKIPNFYGLQRFGTDGRGTHLVGKAIVLGEFEGAAKLILSGLTETGPASSKWLDVERRVARSLDSHSEDWLRALRAVPLRLRRLYVQAFQSYIFNRSLSKALRAGEDISLYQRGDNWAAVSGDGIRTSYPQSSKELPAGDATPLVQLPGYSFRNYGSRFDRHVEEALDEEGVAPGRFFIKEMQEASAEGGFRRPHLAAADLAWKVEEGTAFLAFVLARGQYATVLLREILKPEDPPGAGLA